ncbi:MAG: NAD(P)/FAD-dependent oxidoreductase [Clostridia bacterium]|nr:NAD(P)/FAD-dependent oxidoreductase [Clostridia bacterium]
MYDIAVIGSGPAGVSAVLTLKALDKNFIWFSSGSVSKKVEQAHLIKNYPGLPDITGSQLALTFQNHYEGMNIKLMQEVVSGVYVTDGYFTLLAGDKQYEAKCVILCIGVENVKPIEGEEQFVGRGVSYCATCDGFLYKGKTIGVLCTDKKYEHEIEFLADIAKKAYVFPLYSGYEIKSKNAEIVLKAPLKLTGSNRLERVEYKGGGLDIDGMFILKGAVSPATLVHGLAVEGGHIMVKRDLSTNIAGIFAAGDCTGRPYQYVKSAGEGNVAAHSAVEYLAQLKK